MAVWSDGFFALGFGIAFGDFSVADILPFSGEFRDLIIAQPPDSNVDLSQENSNRAWLAILLLFFLMAQLRLLTPSQIPRLGSSIEGNLAGWGYRLSPCTKCL